MAPRSEYITPQWSPSDMTTTNVKELQVTIEFNNEDDHGAISIFKHTLSNTDLRAIDDVIQFDDEDVQQAPTNNCPCHKPRVRRSLLPELELEAIRLSPTGPWFTLSRSQYKRSKSQRRKLNDPVKQKLFV